MSPPDPITAAESPQALSALNRWLATMSAQERIACSGRERVIGSRAASRRTLASQEADKALLGQLKGHAVVRVRRRELRWLSRRQHGGSGHGAGLRHTDCTPNDARDCKTAHGGQDDRRRCARV